MCDGGQIFRANFFDPKGSSVSLLALGLAFDPMAIAIDPASEHHSVLIAPSGRRKATDIIKVGVGAPYVGPPVPAQSLIMLPAQNYQAGLGFTHAGVVFYEKPPLVLPMRRAAAMFRFEAPVGTAFSTTPVSPSSYDEQGLSRNSYAPAHGRSEGVFAYHINATGSAVNIVVKLYAVVSRASYGSPSTLPLDSSTTVGTLITTITVTAGQEVTSVYNFGGMRADAYYVTIATASSTDNTTSVACALDLYDA